MTSKKDIVRVSVPMTREAKEALMVHAHAVNKTVAEYIRDDINAQLNKAGNPVINFGIRKWVKYD